MSFNFAVIGVAGYVAPRHLEAIVRTGNRLVAATDPHDAVGVLDRYSLGARFFPEIERFDRHLEKLRRGPVEKRVHYVSICSPNYLHDAHIRLALRVRAHAICEKPLVINPWNLEPLEDLERETGCRVFTVLQLRAHPALVALREKIKRKGRRRHQVELTYVTGRGPWYFVSWKGNEEKSGGLATNIGVHLFDLLLWIFGDPIESRVFHREPKRMAGFLKLSGADVHWFLSLDTQDLPFPAKPGAPLTHRAMTVDGVAVDFTEGFASLHEEVYRRTLAGRGFGIADARPSIELVHLVRTQELSPALGEVHPYLKRHLDRALIGPSGGSR